MNRKLYALLAVLILASMVVGACTPAATAAPTQAPAATQPPAATTGPAATAAPTACAPKQANWDPTSADVGSKVMTVAFQQEPDQADIMFSNMSYAAWVSQMFVAGPGRWDDKNNLVPYLASEIPSTQNGDVSADGLTITWKLKPCLFWSDGQPLTSKDMAFTWKAMMDPANAPISRSGWDQISGIDTPDDQTAVVHFKSLYPAWPTLWDMGPNNGGAGILPEHIFTGKTGLEKDPQIHQPTWASGPFAIKEWVAGDHMTLVRNPNFSGTPAKLDAIQIKFVPDPETALAALKTGDVDFGVDFAESDIQAIQALAPNGVKLRVDPSPEFEHLFFNLGLKAGTMVNGKAIGASDQNGFCPFQDVNVRKAIAMGIDRMSFITNYLHEDQKAFIATLWPNSYWTDTSLQPYPYDPTQAASLLDAAGYKAGPDGVRAGPCKEPDGTTVNAKFSLGLETTTAQRRIDDMAAIQADLKKIGIDVKPNPIPAGTYFGSYSEGADLETGKFDMGIFTTGYYPDPDATSSWDCADVPSKANPSGANDYHLCDPKLDAMFKAGLATADPAARQKVYDQIQQYMYDNALMVPLYARALVYAYNQAVTFPPTSGYSNAFWDSENFDINK